MSEYAIEAQGLGKRFRLQKTQAPGTLVDAVAGWFKPRERQAGGRTEEFWALRELDVKIGHGEAIGVIGRNGAGKSTLLKILSRVTEPTTGRLVLRGRVASLLEVGTGFHMELSGRENIFLNGAILGMRRSEIAKRFDAIVDYAGVEKFLETPLKRYSSGMYLRLAFSVAAFLESEILIVDEVLAVGDMSFQKKCLGTMQDAARSGRTVLFVSHNTAAIANLTRRCLLLDGGRMEFDGPTGRALELYSGLKLSRMWEGLKPVAEIDCDRRWRGDVVARFGEVGMGPDQSEDIPVGGSLRLEFSLDCDQPVEGLRVGYSLNSRTGMCVLSGLSPLFEVKRGRALYELSIDQLDVQPGEYDLSLSLGIGGWDAQKWEMDCLVGFGHLRVVDQFADDKPFGTWNTEWARALHRRSSLAVREASWEPA